MRSQRTRGTRGWKPLQYRVERVTGAESFLVKKARKEYELRLCSVRVPDRLHDYVAAAFSELLLFQRVQIRFCCRDENGNRRGVIAKIDSDLLVGELTVNDLAIACGFGVEEARCRRCLPPAALSASTARRHRRRLLLALHNRADRWTSHILEKH